VARSINDVTLCPVSLFMVAERYLGDTFRHSAYQLTLRSVMLTPVLSNCMSDFTM
jgi:hypothetical protein